MTRGYLAQSGIAVLEIDEALPRGKSTLSQELQNRWFDLLGDAIADLAERAPVHKFQKAMVGIHIVTSDAGSRKPRFWDTSNRALNLVFNRLKGIFYADDNYQNLAFAVTGGSGEAERTMIFIGNFRTQATQVMELLLRQDTQ